MNIILKIQLIIVVIVLLLNMNGYMTYGYGLGDIYCIGVFITLLFIIGILHLLIKKDLITVILIFILLIYSFLQMTIYRETEYPWNGEIFLN